ncbi:MAG: YceI family protein [Bacteroidetes bacterium]|nr:YceI family protein [Bacteroidota bacterium]
MKKLVVMLTVLVAASTTFAQTWSLDKSHAKLGFSVTHLLVSDVEGSFKNFDVKVTSAKDDFSDAAITLTADVASINTDNEQRDGHLKSGDFFDVSKFPTLTFKSSSLKKVADKKYKLSGDLTLHGVTKPVTLDVTLNGTAVHPYNKKTVAGFKITGTIKRSDFGIGESTPGAVVSDEVTLTSNVEITKD